MRAMRALETRVSAAKGVPGECEHRFVSTTRARIAALLAQGVSMDEVARRTGLAYTTVSYHQTRLAEEREQLRTATAEALEPEPFLVHLSTRGEVHRLLRAGLSRAAVARKLGVSKSTVTYHARRFGMTVDARAARRHDWKVIQRYYDEGHSVQECRARFGFSTASWCGAVRQGRGRRAGECDADRGAACGPPAPART